MRATLVLGFLLLSRLAHAKGPTFPDLVSEIALPAEVAPGDTFEIRARIEVGAYCQRTRVFAGPTCAQQAVHAAGNPELRLYPGAPGPEEPVRWTEITAALVAQPDGTFRGVVTTLPCQRSGVYRLSSLEANPALESATLTIAAAPACGADRSPPKVERVLVPSRLALPARPPRDSTEWTHGRLIVEVADDASGAHQAWYVLTDNRHPFEYGTLGTGTLKCSRCGRRSICTADLPLCGDPNTKEVVVRISQIIDGAGHVTTWLPDLHGAPLAVVRCGGESAPPPRVACPAPRPAERPMTDAAHDADPPDAATTNPATDRDAEAPADAGPAADTSPARLADAKMAEGPPFGTAAPDAAVGPRTADDRRPGDASWTAPRVTKPVSGCSAAPGSSANGGSHVLSIAALLGLGLASRRANRRAGRREAARVVGR